MLNNLKRIVNIKNQIFKKEIENNIDEKRKKEINEKFQKYNKIFNKRKINRELSKSSTNSSKAKGAKTFNEYNNINCNNNVLYN